MRWSYALIIGLCLHALLVGGASAQELIERLVMPGPLAASHANVEKQCNKCHESFTTRSQPRLCLDCHKEIAKDRATKSGYHGRQNDAMKEDCRQCHTDHKGRDADIMLLDRERFDHDLARYRLVDSHKAVACASCHEARKPFHKASSVCYDCHKAKDIHKGNLGQKCEGCHKETTWRDTKPFDHSKTKFDLVGAHKNVKCQTCHTGEIYKDLPRTCISCHKLQDIHGGRYSDKCEACHNQVKWKQASFDHDKKTKFPLKGVHAKVKCDACHPRDLYKDKLSVECVSCHRKDDVHKGSLGDRCDRCHNEVDWKKYPKFNHQETRFPLIGKHAKIACGDCHKTKLYKDTPIACEKCHPDKVHQGRLGVEPKCGTCHTALSWRDWHYDHAKQAHYPLLGIHARIKCEACHKEKGASLKLPTACESCHKDEQHKGRLGARPKCGDCHTPEAWSKWRFDHAERAHYPLTGAHARAKCESCHHVANPPTLKLPGQCVDCHRKDDPHLNAFGSACDRCHNTSSWRQVKIRN